MDFAPSIYEHAARVIDKSPWEVSRDGDLLARANIEAYRLYHHSPIVVGIDIYNLEPEAYGSIIDPPDGDAIPAISRHACSSVQEIIRLQPFDPKTAGRIPMVIQAARRIADELPQADVRVPVSGPFSIACNLVGFDRLLTQVINNPDEVAEALGHLVVGQIEFCREIVQHGLDIAFFESAAAPPLLSPQSFREIELPVLKTILEKAAEVVGHPVPCIIGGNTAPILEAMLETGTRYVCCPAETDQEQFMQIMKKYPDVMVRVNMDPIHITSENMDAAYAEADRVIALANTREKSCIGTGCLPYETNPQAVLKTREHTLTRTAGE